MSASDAVQHAWDQWAGENAFNESAFANVQHAAFVAGFEAGASRSPEYDYIGRDMAGNPDMDTFRHYGSAAPDAHYRRRKAGPWELNPERS